MTLFFASRAFSSGDRFDLAKGVFALGNGAHIAGTDIRGGGGGGVIRRNFLRIGLERGMQAAPRVGGLRGGRSQLRRSPRVTAQGRFAEIAAACGAWQSQRSAPPLFVAAGLGKIRVGL